MARSILLIFLVAFSASAGAQALTYNYFQGSYGSVDLDDSAVGQLDRVSGLALDQRGQHRNFVERGLDVAKRDFGLRSIYGDQHDDGALTASKERLIIREGRQVGSCFARGLGFARSASCRNP